MGGPGVESPAPGGVPPSPQPPTPHPIRPRDPGAHKRQGLLLCAEQPEVGLATAQDRITIYGPKDDCTYMSNSGWPKAMRLRSQAKAEQLAPSSHPGRPGASPSWGVAQPDRAALHHMQLVRTCARGLQLVATRPLAGLDTRAAAPFLIRRRSVE